MPSAWRRRLPATGFGPFPFAYGERRVARGPSRSPAANATPALGPSRSPAANPTPPGDRPVHRRHPPPLGHHIDAEAPVRPSPIPDLRERGRNALNRRRQSGPDVFWGFYPCKSSRSLESRVVNWGFGDHSHLDPLQTGRLRAAASTLPDLLAPGTGLLTLTSCRDRRRSCTWIPTGTRRQRQGYRA